MTFSSYLLRLRRRTQGLARRSVDERLQFVDSLVALAKHLLRPQRGRSVNLTISSALKIAIPFSWITSLLPQRTKCGRPSPPWSHPVLRAYFELVLVALSHVMAHPLLAQAEVCALMDSSLDGVLVCASNMLTHHRKEISIEQIRLMCQLIDAHFAMPRVRQWSAHRIKNQSSLCLAVLGIRRKLEEHFGLDASGQRLNVDFSPMTVCMAAELVAAQLVPSDATNDLAKLILRQTKRSRTCFPLCPGVSIYTVLTSRAKVLRLVVCMPIRSYLWCALAVLSHPLIVAPRSIQQRTLEEITTFLSILANLASHRAIPQDVPMKCVLTNVSQLMQELLRLVAPTDFAIVCADRRVQFRALHGEILRLRKVETENDPFIVHLFEALIFLYGTVRDPTSSLHTLYMLCHMSLVALMPRLLLQITKDLTMKWQRRRRLLKVCATLSRVSAAMTFAVLPLLKQWLIRWLNQGSATLEERKLIVDDVRHLATLCRDRVVVS